MRIYTHITFEWDDARNEYVEVSQESHDYGGPVVFCCGATSGQQNIANTQTSTYGTLVNQAQQVFGNSSTVFNDLVSTLSPTVQAGPNQQGFSPAEVSALNSSAITNAGNAYRNARQAVGESEAAQGGGNVADVSGGSKTATDLGIAESAAAQTSNSLNEIQQANYATGRQNYDTAVTDLSGAPSVFNPATSAASAATNAGEQAANSENQIASQDNSWVNAVTGALGGVAGIATGGLIKNLGSGSTGGKQSNGNS